MSDFAFNNYCIACDKLCSHNSIYCSEECKNIDENQSSHLLEPQHQQSEEELVSPLLTPNLYQHYNNYTPLNYESASPLLLLKSEDDKDFDYYNFDLNYSVSEIEGLQNQSSNIAGHLPSTSHNYRKWLTACL